MGTDSEAIAALIYRYAERIDAGDFDGLAELFAQATLRTAGRPQVRRGVEEVVALYRNTVVLYDGLPCTQHVTTNLVIEIDTAPCTASARSCFTVLQRRPELPLQVIIAGRYHDTFAYADGAWRFTDRLIHADLLGDLRFHLKQDPFAP